MHECRCEQDAGSEMAHHEEEGGWDTETGRFYHEERECTCCSGHGEDDEDRADVQWEVVVLD